MSVQHRTRETVVPNVFGSLENPSTYAQILHDRQQHHSTSHERRTTLCAAKHAPPPHVQLSIEQEEDASPQRGYVYQSLLCLGVQDQKSALSNYNPRIDKVGVI